MHLCMYVCKATNKWENMQFRDFKSLNTADLNEKIFINYNKKIHALLFPKFLQQKKAFLNVDFIYTKSVFAGKQESCSTSCIHSQ